MNTDYLLLHCSKEKTHINVVVIGHVDSGKSTTTGMLSSHPLSTMRHTHFPQAISSTNAVVSTSVLLRNLKRYGCLMNFPALRCVILALTHRFGGAQNPAVANLPIVFPRLKQAAQRLLTTSTGSPRIGQGLLQVRMGARQIEGRA